MSQLPIRITPALTAFALACFLTLATAGPALAGKPKSVQTEAEWVAFDAEAKTITAKVKKPGRGVDAKKLKKNKSATWAVKPEGSVLTRTTVAINGVKGELADIPKGKTVNIYWRPDEQDPNILRARKVDVILSDAELDAKYGAE
jgi:hypothetical protein